MIFMLPLITMYSLLTTYSLTQYCADMSAEVVVWYGMVWYDVSFRSSLRLFIVWHGCLQPF
jgi:hypothetical protein